MEDTQIGRSNNRIDGSIGTINPKEKKNRLSIKIPANSGAMAGGESEEREAYRESESEGEIGRRERLATQISFVSERSMSMKRRRSISKRRRFVWVCCNIPFIAF